VRSPPHRIDEKTVAEAMRAHPAGDYVLAARWCVVKASDPDWRLTNAGRLMWMAFEDHAKAAAAAPRNGRATAADFLALKESPTGNGFSRNMEEWLARNGRRGGGWTAADMYALAEEQDD
jgi:hypothetical protein